MDLVEQRRQFERAVAPLEIGGPELAGWWSDDVKRGQFALDVSRDGRAEAARLSPTRPSGRQAGQATGSRRLRRLDRARNLSVRRPNRLRP